MTLQIPGYTFIRKIGEGGCADVYLAVQENLNRRVAMKLLKHSLTADKDFHKRFNREGRIIAQLSHPHIVSVYDIGVYEQHYYMSMEYLPAGDLKSCAQQITLGEFLEILKQIVQALDVAHQQGFVHRDIKPSNILFREPNFAVLTDFGIARKTESLTQMTMTGAFLGTPAYMSPEQINGQEVDGRTDLYSLGVTLFEMLSGYQPYRSNSAVNVVIQHLNTEIPMLPAVTAPFQPIVNSLLCKDPAGRMPSAMALNDALYKLKLSEHLSNKKLTSLWSERVPNIDATTNIYSPSSASTQQNRPALIVAFSSLLILVLGSVWLDVIWP